MKVWNNGEFINIEIGQRFTVGRCGSGHTVFGEGATLTKALTKNLVFTTDSGAIVKTEIDTLNTVGKAAKERYWVSVNTPEDFTDFISSETLYWDEKKCKLVNK